MLLLHEFIRDKLVFVGLNLTTKVLVHNCMSARNPIVCFGWRWRHGNLWWKVTVTFPARVVLCNVVHHTARHSDGAAALWQHPQLGVQAVEAALQLPDRPAIEKLH